MIVFLIALFVAGMLAAAVLLAEIILDVQERRRRDREVEEPDVAANARPLGNVVVLPRERSE